MFVDIVFMVAVVLVFGPLVWNKLYGKTENVFGTFNKRHHSIIL